MSDDDGDWKPNGRPQSTLARSFSAALNEAFMIDSSLDGLSQSVEQKKRAVSSQSQELEALEARLRETEERLKQRQSRASSPAAAGSGRKSTHRRPGIGRTFGGEGSEQEQAPATSPLAAQPLSSQSRPSTGKAPSYTVPPMPGAMPETPGDIGKSDYGMVDRGGGTQQYEGFNPNGFDQGHQGDFAPQPTRRPPPKPSD